MVRTKVFVGNLDFKTKEADLATFFGTAGKVVGANIITRRNRSLGYGFVELDTLEDATKACAQLNKQTLDGRAINVELAKVRDPNEEKPKRERPVGRRPPRGPRAPREGGVSDSKAERPERPERKPRATGNANGTQESDKPRRRGPQRRTRKFQGTRKPKAPQEPRVHSKTLLFVANLPYSFDDASFGAAIKAIGVAFSKAHVVPAKFGNRNKGFGFLEFENEDGQQKALKALEKKSVGEPDKQRELVVKVAFVPAEPPKTDAPAATTPAPAANTAAPAKKEEAKKN